MWIQACGMHHFSSLQTYSQTRYGSAALSSSTRGGAASGTQSPASTEQLSKTNLYIRGLAATTTDRDLYAFCQRYQQATHSIFVFALCQMRLLFTATTLSLCLSDISVAVALSREWQYWWQSSIFPYLWTATLRQLAQWNALIWRIETYFFSLCQVFSVSSPLFHCIGQHWLPHNMILVASSNCLVAL